MKKKGGKKRRQIEGKDLALMTDQDERNFK